MDKNDVIECEIDRVGVSANLVSDFNSIGELITAVVSSPVAVGFSLIKQMKDPKKLCKDYSDYRFCEKLLYFFNWVHLTEQEFVQLSNCIGQCDIERKENYFRLFDCIQAVTSFKQIHYMANATRTLISLERKEGSYNRARLNDYFRVIIALMRMIPEDIEFLQEHIREDDIEEGVEVEGLDAAGVMWHSEIDARVSEAIAGQKYSFNRLGRLVYNYACLLDDVNNNPDMKLVDLELEKRVKIEHDVVGDEEVDTIFKNY